MGKPKVLHVMIGLEIGGAEILLTHLLPKLNPEKYDITVCALKKWGVIADRLSLDGIKVIPLNGSNKFSIGIFYKLLQLIRKKQYDIVQSHLFLGNVVTAIVLFFHKILIRRKAPVFIITAHDLGLWQKWYQNILGKFAYLLADRIVCCSQAVKISKLSRFKVKGEKCEVIFNGINFIEPNLRNLNGTNSSGIQQLVTSAKEAYIIGTIGRLDDRVKGFKYLIQAIKLIEKQINCTLIIIGDGPDKKDLENLIEKLQLSQHVKIIKELFPINPIPFFDLFVLPSISEGFGLVLLEAMADSKPIVATNVGGIPEVVIDGQTGILVPPKDPGALAKAIQYMKDHPSEAEEMGKRGKKRGKENFTIERMVAKTEALYDQLIKERRPFLPVQAK